MRPLWLEPCWPASQCGATAARMLVANRRLPPRYSNRCWPSLFSLLKHPALLWQLIKAHRAHHSTHAAQDGGTISFGPASPSFLLIRAPTVRLQLIATATRPELRARPQQQTLGCPCALALRQPWPHSPAAYLACQGAPHGPRCARFAVCSRYQSQTRRSAAICACSGCLQPSPPPPAPSSAAARPAIASAPADRVRVSLLQGSLLVCPCAG